MYSTGEVRRFQAQTLSTPLTPAKTTAGSASGRLDLEEDRVPPGPQGEGLGDRRPPGGRLQGTITVSTQR